MRFQYTTDDLIDAFKEVGIESGDIVFTHVSLGRLGWNTAGRDIETTCRELLRAFRAVLTNTGTLLVPTYSYSIGKGELFDVEETPSTTGPFSEFVRKQPDTFRSRDPMLSVVGLGSTAMELIRDLPHTSYGKGSIYERIRKRGAKLCMVGLGLYWATFRHHIEEMSKVPFRFIKEFTGEIKENGITSSETWEYFAAPFLSNCAPDGLKLERLLRDREQCQTASIGLSEVVAIDAQEYYNLGMDELARDPWLTAKGPACSDSDMHSSRNASKEVA